MPEKKKLTEMSDPEVLKKLFPQKAIRKMKEVAHEKDPKKKK